MLRIVVWLFFLVSRFGFSSPRTYTAELGGISVRCPHSLVLADLYRAIGRRSRDDNRGLDAAEEIVHEYFVRCLGGLV